MTDDDADGDDDGDDLEDRKRSVGDVLGTPGDDEDEATATAATGLDASTSPASSSSSSTSGRSGSGRSPTPSEDPTTTTDVDDAGGPPFAFDEATKETVYVRQASWTQLQARAKALEATLIEEDGIDDLAGREVHDAMVRLAADNEDLLREAILEARGEP